MLFVLQVTMTEQAAAERACKDPNPVIDGRKANVNLAYIGAKPRILHTTGTINTAVCQTCFRSRSVVPNEGTPTFHSKIFMIRQSSGVLSLHGLS